MPVLYRASFGYLMRHPWQLALAVIGICIGVAVMVAVVWVAVAVEVAVSVCVAVLVLVVSDGISPVASE